MYCVAYRAYVRRYLRRGSVLGRERVDSTRVRLYGAKVHSTSVSFVVLTLFSIEHTLCRAAPALGKIFYILELPVVLVLLVPVKYYYILAQLKTGKSSTTVVATYISY